MARVFLLRDRREAAQLTDGEALLLWTAHAITLKKVLPTEALLFVLQELRWLILEAGKEIGHTHRAGIDPPAYHLGIADGGRIACTGDSRTFDMGKGVWVEGLPSGELWMQTLNLTTLFVGSVTLMKKQSQVP